MKRPNDELQRYTTTDDLTPHFSTGSLSILILAIMRSRWKQSTNEALSSSAFRVVPGWFPSDRAAIQ